MGVGSKHLNRLTGTSIPNLLTKSSHTILEIEGRGL